MTARKHGDSACPLCRAGIGGEHIDVDFSEYVERKLESGRYFLMDATGRPELPEDSLRRLRDARRLAPGKGEAQLGCTGGLHAQNGEAESAVGGRHDANVLDQFDDSAADGELGQIAGQEPRLIALDHDVPLPAILLDDQSEAVVEGGNGNELDRHALSLSGLASVLAGFFARIMRCQRGRGDVPAADTTRRTGA